MDATHLQANFDNNAAEYAKILTTPLGILEAQLCSMAIANCQGLTVLDLGGGSGYRARDALNAGAHLVDVVDISPAMMREGQEYEKSIGRDRITWYEGDVAGSLDHLPLGTYDMVIANGIFDHAHTNEELYNMWRNTALYLKPGGRFVFNRSTPLSKAALDGRYGVLFTDFRDIPGPGICFNYGLMTDPPLNFPTTMLEANYSDDMKLPREFFTDLELVPWEGTALVKAEPDFWKDFLADPIMFVYTARKPNR